MDNNKLYHYTSLDGFKGIISSNSFWLSNSFKTNDKREIIWVLDKIREMYPEKAEVINKLSDFYKIWISNYFRPHIGCFSRNRDQLSQWRAYGNDGKGICIGFNKEYFEQIREIDNKEFKIQDVLYDIEEQKEIISEMIARISNLSKSDFPDYPNVDIESFDFFDIIEECDNGFSGMLLTSLLLDLGIEFKNSCFEEEEEVRLVHGYNKLAAEPDMFKYRFTDDDMITYIDIPLFFEGVDIKAISEIIIGPKCKITIKDLEQYLGYQGDYRSIEINVLKSSASYV